jgi:hypothetical protein
VYVALIKQAVVNRIWSECSTHSNALDDVKVLNTTNPPSLTSSFTIFEKADLERLFHQKNIVGLNMLLFWVTFVWNMYYFYVLWIIYTADYYIQFTCRIKF